ncbi:MAG: tRNA (adenosine(37)-N6)-dimethylallyltransferase MiaA, partial [Candidatus Paceibacterota bacterium]
MKQRVLIILGPTASGKSALGVALAKKFNGEIISADSRQVYKGLDIGTGKITKREMQGVAHHLLDVASSKKNFSANDFVELGRIAIQDCVGRGKLPIIVGGTGFYIDSLVGRIVLPDVPPDLKLRARLENKSAKQLFALLARRDPRRAKTIEPNNKRRIIRALEIAAALGTVPAIKDRPLYNVLWIGIAPPDAVLRKNITIRLFARLRQGFGGQARTPGGMIGEARRLRAAGLTYKRMNELGLEYRSLARHLQNK